MREFFKPWRRKFGVATLVSACVFMAGFVRSLDTWDVIAIETPWETRIAIESGKQYCELCSGPSEREFPSLNWWASELDGVVSLDEYLNAVPSQSRYRGFGIAIMGSPRSRYGAIAFPYWFPIVPLTLLSACLLLSKRRQTAPNQSTESAPTTGT